MGGNGIEREWDGKRMGKRIGEKEIRLNGKEKEPHGMGEKKSEREWERKK